MGSNLQIYKNDIEANLKNIKKYKLDILILQRQNEELCKKNNEEIDRLTNKIIDMEQEMKINLKGSGERKIETPAGWCAFRQMPDKWDYIDSDILTWCKNKNMPYYHTVEIVEKMKLKKAITEGKVNLVEILGIKVTPQEPKFNYKLNSGGELL